ncbi:hypothetical protein SNEBB_001957 [Seison nebaliae]|nr:hypothetical protein SNEBB_001957 [Seison nebaliae]
MYNRANSSDHSSDEKFCFDYYHRTQSIDEIIMEKTEDELKANYILNYDEEDEMQIQSFRINNLKLWMCRLLSILSIGFAYLVFYWKPSWWLKITHDKCRLNEADRLLLIDQYRQEFVEMIQTEEVSSDLLSIFNPISYKIGREGNVSVPFLNLVQMIKNDGCKLVTLFNKKLKYVWKCLEGEFCQLNGLDTDSLKLSMIHKMPPLTTKQNNELLKLYGENVLNLQLTPIWKVLLQEIISPFYIFQIFSVILWCTDQYYFYSGCIFIISVISVTLTLVQTRRNEKHLLDMVSLSHDQMTNVFRRNENETVQRIKTAASQLVPGEIIEIPKNGCLMECDAILLNGECIVNECMLTGESVPVTKTALPNPQEYNFNMRTISLSSTKKDDIIKEDFPPKQSTKQHLEETFTIEKCSKNVLFCGTNVIQGRYYGDMAIKAIVIRTGYTTTKGRLLLSILYPKPLHYQFQFDTYKFVGVLSMIALVGLIATIVIMTKRSYHVGAMIKRALDLITICVPPALSAALTSSLMFAQQRLKTKKIFCVAPSSINQCGTLDTFVFDKTGTLTEDGLNLMGIIPVGNSRNYISLKFPSLTNHHSIEHQSSSIMKDERNELEGEESKKNHVILLDLVRNVSDNLPTSHHIIECMATCHSIIRLSGVLNGDPLDLKMFESTGWSFINENDNMGNNESINNNNDIEELDDGITSSNYQSIVQTIVRSPSSDESIESIINSSGDVNISGNEIGIVRQFPFSSALQRMSVIVRHMTANSFTIYVKGAPEIIASLCIPESVPTNLEEILQYYTQEGYRVIALAMRESLKLPYTKIMKISRKKIENDLQFLGLLILENRLKKETEPILLQLRDANIRTIMCTGDNILTAISVAHDCELIDENIKILIVEAEKKKLFSSSSSQQISTENNETKIINTSQYPQSEKNLDLEKKLSESKDLYEIKLTYAEQLKKREMSNIEAELSDLHNCALALTGTTFRILRDYFYEDIFQRIIERGAIFARMLPDQKQQLIEELQQTNSRVGMCGDGANDCGALKTANAGISLSCDQEASIASPFTSQNNDISCVPILMKEGRASLVTSFGVVKYICLYSLIQFFTVFLLYLNYNNLTDVEFIYIDFFILTILVMCFTRTEAFPTLSKIPPSIKLINWRTIISIIGTLVIMVVIQTVMMVDVKNQIWYIPVNKTMAIEHEIYTSDLNTTLFFVSSFQYIICAVIFSKGRPFRKMIYSNYIFLFSLIVITLTTSAMLLWPIENLYNFFQLKVLIDKNYAAIILLVACINFVICIIFESIIIEQEFSIIPKLFNFVYYCVKSCGKDHGNYELKQMKMKTKTINENA